MKAYGAASQYGFILPYSRKHELEADHIGLMLMAKAGYDPTEAPRFWQRFGQINAGNKPTEFFSTHPSDESRAAALTALLPEAQNVYQIAQQKFGSGEVIPASLTTPTTAPGTAAPAGFGAGAAPLNPPALSLPSGAPPAFMPPAGSAAPGNPPGFTPPPFTPPPFVPPTPAVPSGR